MLLKRLSWKILRLACIESRRENGSTCTYSNSMVLLNALDHSSWILALERDVNMGGVSIVVANPPHKHPLMALWQWPLSYDSTTKCTWHMTCCILSHVHYLHLHTALAHIYMQTDNTKSLSALYWWWWRESAQTGIHFSQLHMVLTSSWELGQQHTGTRQSIK